jgi:hypothetical protein
MKLLLCCFVPAKDRSDPTLAWRASVQYGPIVYRATRRQAIRSAAEAWLKDADAPASSYAVNLALKTELTVRQLSHPKTMDYMNADTGMLSLRRTSDEG